MVLFSSVQLQSRPSGGSVINTKIIHDEANTRSRADLQSIVSQECSGKLCIMARTDNIFFLLKFSTPKTDCSGETTPAMNASHRENKKIIIHVARTPSARINSRGVRHNRPG